MKKFIAVVSFLVFEAVFIVILYLISAFITLDMDWMVNVDGFFRFIFVLLSIACILPALGATIEVVNFINDRL